MPIIHAKPKTIHACPPSRRDNSYKIFIQNGIINKLPEYLKKMNLGDDYALITDTKTEKLFGRSLVKFLKSKGIKVEMISFDQGEKSKNLKTVEELAEKMIEKKFDRRDAIIVLGGGVAGDIGGFLASIYYRGIPYIQIPTTLLAMVDSAIGGKTGVDLKSGKNLIGTITQPKAVFIDTNYLKTLPENQIRNGLAEIIKCGVIKDAKLFKFIEQNLDKILKLDKKAINYIIQRSVEIKVEIIEHDEKESGQRMILNYGHTYVHALEKLSNYTLLHGYAISIGMVIANKIAIQKRLLKPAVAERIKNLLKKAELPVTTI
ncbi:MAG: 3-dehydroquinate synthase, partial [Patescibacteria group bacterium]